MNTRDAIPAGRVFDFGLIEILFDLIRFEMRMQTSAQSSDKIVSSSFRLSPDTITSDLTTPPTDRDPGLIAPGPWISGVVAHSRIPNCPPTLEH